MTDRAMGRLEQQRDFERRMGVPERYQTSVADFTRFAEDTETDGLFRGSDAEEETEEPLSESLTGARLMATRGELERCRAKLAALEAPAPKAMVA